MDHMMMARVSRINAEILAISIEVDGMKTANMERLAKGESLAYPDSDFFNAANNVRGFAAELFQLSV